jgi:hypothetical protein
LSEVDRIDRSPVARNPMPPRVLYSVHYSPACGLGLKP